VTRYAGIAALFLASAFLGLIGGIFALVWLARRHWVTVRAA
jgi:hypothetical protein